MLAVKSLIKPGLDIYRTSTLIKVISTQVALLQENITRSKVEIAEIKSI